MNRLAIFDFDWTIIKPLEGRTHPKDIDDWQWFRKSVPDIIKDFSKSHSIVIRTDQSKNWKNKMIINILNSLDIKYTLIIANNKNEYKPDTKLFTDMYESYDHNNSFYVGDAAGRNTDWSSVDKDFAKKLDIKFYVPEEIFPIEISNKSDLILHKDNKEVIIMIGYPASGKTTIAKQLTEYNYVRINGDLLKTSKKMIVEAKKHIDKSSIIFDATNSSKKKRLDFIEFGKSNKVPIRAFIMRADIDTAMDRNKERSKDTNYISIPNIAYYVYRKNFEEPTLDEGFDEIISIN